VLLVAAPFVVAMMASFVGSWYVTSDAAILATRVLDAPDDLPLVGVYSRFGWYHPGPALAWWFMVPSWVSGGAPSVLLAAGIALKGLAAVVATVLAGRRGGLVGAALIGALAMTLFVNHADTPYSIWNPTLVVLCFLCLVVAGWALAAGDRWAAPVLVVAGSVCTQAHVGYLPLVVVVSGFAAVLATVGAWHTSPRGRGWRAAMLVAGGLGVLLWAPVLIDQIFVSGNLGAIVDYFAGPEEPALGLAGALGRAARASVPWGPWVGGIEPVGLLGDLLEAPIWWLLFSAAALGASGVAAWWKRDRELAALTAVVTVTSVAGVVTLGLLSDVPYPYLYSWSRVVGGLVWCTLALAAVRALVAGRPRWDGAVRAVVVAMTVSIAVVALVVVPTGPRPDARLSDAVEALLPAANEATAPGEVIAMTFTEAFPGVGPGLVYELERAGRHVTVPPDSAFVWSGTRGADPDSADVELAVASGVALATFAADPRWEELARFDPLTPDEREEYEELAAALRRRIEDSGYPDVAPVVLSAPSLFVGDPNLDDRDLARLIELSPRREMWALYRAR